MKRRLKQNSQGYTFLELLLDETLCQGEIIISEELVRRVGGINEKLKAKQKYELVLRIAQEMPIIFEEVLDDELSTDSAKMDVWCGNGNAGEIRLSDDEDVSLGWQTDCYVAGKYSGELRDSGYFDAVLQSLMGEAMQEGRYEETLAFMEQMVGKSQVFYELDDATRPILIYKGDTICHNLLTVFAEEFGRALEAQGQQVIYFDVAQEELGNIVRFFDQRFKAIIGFQTYMYKIKTKDGAHDIHENIYGPKFNFIFDHPIWARNYLDHQFPDFHVLTHDANYVEFLQKYYQKDAILFPPAGMCSQVETECERIYDLSFVGALGDYKSEVMFIHQMERKYRFWANRFLLKMRKEPNLPAEKALLCVLQERGEQLTQQEFFELFYELRRVSYCVTHYYRYQVLKVILESGIRVDVFGNSWLGSDLRKYSNLVCHEDVTVDESLEIMRKSKMSLNVMSWHKGGFTERMANIMLAGAVLVTDDTTYLDGNGMKDDMVVFCLDELGRLPKQIKEVLADEEKRAQMAQRGMEKVRGEHTWEKRAEELLRIL